MMFSTAASAPKGQSEFREKVFSIICWKITFFQFIIANFPIYKITIFIVFTIITCN